MGEKWWLSLQPPSQQGRRDVPECGMTVNLAWVNGWDGAAAIAAGRPDCSAAAPVYDPVSAPF